MRRNSLDKSKLTRVNRIVYKKYCKKADDAQKAKMRKVLSEQIDNLVLLLDLMDLDK